MKVFLQYGENLQYCCKGFGRLDYLSVINCKSDPDPDPSNRRLKHFPQFFSKKACKSKNNS